jgi:hypothetical protein
MRQPTEAEQQLASERVEELARMGLGGGIAIFSDGLERVLRCSEKYWEEEVGLSHEIRLRIPSAVTFAADEELRRACQHELSEGLFDRSNRCRLMIADFHFHVGDDETGLGLLDGVEDPVERELWRKRLTRKDGTPKRTRAMAERRRERTIRAEERRRKDETARRRLRRQKQAGGGRNARTEKGGK